MNPKMVGPETTCPSMRIEGAPSAWSARTSSDSTTGRPTSRAMKTVPRDQSIRASERSKIRVAAPQSDGARRAAGGSPMAGPVAGAVAGAAADVMGSLHQVLEDGLQVVVGRGDLVDRPDLVGRRQRRDPRVERIGLAGLD